VTILFQLVLIFIILISFVVMFSPQVNRNDNQQNMAFVCMLSIAAFTVTVIL